MMERPKVKSDFALTLLFCFGRKRFSIVFLFSLFLFSLAQKGTAQDSTHFQPLGIKPRLLQLSPLKLKGDSLQLQMNYLHNKVYRIPSNAIDLREVMPENRLFWDYRESSYYTPLSVKNKLARIMDRPTPGEVLPIFPVALIAAKLALQQIEINKKIAIKPKDYLVPKKYWPILKALWNKSPQSAIELYRIKEVQQGRTVKILKNELQFLGNHKLIKPKKMPNHPTVYFPAQSRGKAIALLEKALRSDQYSLKFKKHWLDLRNYLVNHGQ